MLDLSEKMQYMLDNQYQWAIEFKEKKDLYKLTKNRAEKARAKEAKRVRGEHLHEPQKGGV